MAWHCRGQAVPPYRHGDAVALLQVSTPPSSPLLPPPLCHVLVTSLPLLMEMLALPCCCCFCASVCLAPSQLWCCASCCYAYATVVHLPWILVAAALLLCSMHYCCLLYSYCGLSVIVHEHPVMLMACWLAPVIIIATRISCVCIILSLAWSLCMILVVCKCQCLCSWCYLHQLLKCIHLWCSGLFAVCNSCKFTSASTPVCSSVCYNYMIMLNWALLLTWQLHPLMECFWIQS
jgi:hypothetical protein